MVRERWGSPMRWRAAARSVRRRLSVDRGGVAAELGQLRDVVRRQGRRARRSGQETATQLRLLRLDLARMGAQLGALETRFADLEEGRAADPASTTDPAAAGAPAATEVADLLDQVRAEHARLRIRFGVVTAYEERVRRLEETVFGEQAELR